jgi:PEP-CTERM motif
MAHSEEEMKRLILSCCLLFSAVALQAGLIETQPAGTTTVLTTVTGTYTTSPSVVAGGFTVTGETLWYGDSSFGLLDNGSWDSFAWVGGYCYSGDCTATINLGGLYASVGGFMNYAASGGGAYGPGDPVISAIAADGTTVLQSYDLVTDAPISTPSGLNAGAFRGISSSTADIAYLRISGSYLIMHDITLSSAAASVPEPATAGVVGLGLVALGFLRRRVRG